MSACDRIRRVVLRDDLRRILGWKVSPYAAPSEIERHTQQLDQILDRIDQAREAGYREGLEEAQSLGSFAAIEQRLTGLRQQDAGTIGVLEDPHHE